MDTFLGKPLYLNFSSDPTSHHGTSMITLLPTSNCGGFYSHAPEVPRVLHERVIGRYILFRCAFLLMSYIRAVVSHCPIRMCEKNVVAQTYGVPFSHLFTELQISAIEAHISPIQLQISPIQLEISAIQLEISPNRVNWRYLQFNWRYLQFNWRYLQINWRYLQIGPIWRYLQFNCRYLQFDCTE